MNESAFEGLKDRSWLSRICGRLGCKLFGHCYLLFDLLLDKTSLGFPSIWEVKRCYLCGHMMLGDEVVGGLPPGSK